MKLFKSLLVAPASLGLLAPMAVTANEVTINDFNAAEEIAVTNSRVDGLEARLNNFEAGSFSETTAASSTLFADTDTETMVNEASYSYPVNDGMTLTPGVFIVEKDGTDDETGVAVKASFAF